MYYWFVHKVIQTYLRQVFIHSMDIDQDYVQCKLDHKCVEVSVLLPLLNTAVKPLK